MAQEDEHRAEFLPLISAGQQKKVLICTFGLGFEIHMLNNTDFYIDDHLINLL